MLLLLLCTWGNICWKFRLPGEVGGGSSNWDCRCCHTRHQLVAYFGPQHLHFQPSSPLLREKLDNALLGDQGICK